jgi:hypothetical protein
MKKKILTRDEEADEIVRRLSTPPVRIITYSYHGIDLEEEISKIIAMEITAEIDKEVLRNLGVRYGKSNI